MDFATYGAQPDQADIASDFDVAEACTEHEHDALAIHEAFRRIALDRIAAEPRGCL